MQSTHYARDTGHQFSILHGVCDSAASSEKSIQSMNHCNAIKVLLKLQLMCVKYLRILLLKLIPVNIDQY